ncbi:ParB-like dsDNA partitioning protein [Mycobacterium phage Jeeves]|uniref:ParB-like dsDNA partitioning protein n=1 Tax=Mycobacterium phage Jeeves TaxID=2652402 RepID=A0A5J6T2X7_9CAUD|nr:Arc-like repressor [Mycobacterium phage Jeeves]QFG04513.1 ParB-like dsDNA partitioning protein [Mycobacterium phage Jeeves]
MSDPTDVRAALRAQAERNKGKKPMDVRDAFARGSDLTTRTNVYILTATLKEMKQRALDEETSVSKLISEAVTSSWSLKDPVRWPKPKKKWETPDIEL